MGLSFAIPIDVAMQVADQLRSSGKVTRGRIGVAIQELTNALAESFGLNKPEGALVSSVEKNAPADKAGIEVSDVILKFDGKSVYRSNDLPRIVAATKPGSKVAVDLWRKGATKQVFVTVAEIPEELKAVKADKNTPNETAETIARLGITARELSQMQQQELQVNGGLLVEKITGSTARSAGLHQGDVLLAIGNLSLNSFAQLNEFLNQVPPGKNVALLVKRGDNATYMAVKLDEK